MFLVLCWASAWLAAVAKDEQAGDSARINPWSPAAWADSPFSHLPRPGREKPAEYGVCVGASPQVPEAAGWVDAPQATVK
jgi:hypothetical protein